MPTLVSLSWCFQTGAPFLALTFPGQLLHAFDIRLSWFMAIILVLFDRLQRISLMHRFSIDDPGFLSVIPGQFATMSMAHAGWGIVTGLRNLGLLFARNVFFNRLRLPPLLRHLRLLLR
jgi:hypothetical protein